MKGGKLMSLKEEVRKASKQFYAGLNSMANGDSGPLADIWSHKGDVTAMHPIGGREVGWDAVRGSFEQVAKLASNGKIELKDQIIEVDGDLAYEVGIEAGQLALAGEQVTIDHRVTNIYQRQAGVWKIVHHHTDISPAMMNVLRRLQAKAA
jgi:ketosteroid isomerase-like protein